MMMGGGGGSTGEGMEFAEMLHVFLEWLGRRLFVDQCWNELICVVRRSVLQ